MSSSVDPMRLDDDRAFEADSETGFRLDVTPPPPPILPPGPPPPPPLPSLVHKGGNQFVASSSKSGENAGDTGAISLSFLEKVAPPVAFAGGTETISASRKNMFHKDLAAQKEAQSHEEAIRLLHLKKFFDVLWNVK